MIKEFCNITGASKEDIEEKWSVITTQVLKYSRMDTRKAVKKLVTRFDEYSEEEGNCGM